MLSNLLLEVEARHVDVLDGAIYALIGLLVVFAGIALLILIISLFGLIMKRINAPQKSEKKASGAKPQPVTETKAEEVPDEIKAAIIAAIMAFYETEKPKCEFTVKRIKRI